MLALILACVWGTCAAAAAPDSVPGIPRETRITRVLPILRAPDSTQQVRVSVESSCVPGPVRGYFDYTYRVTNDPSTRVGIEYFGVGRLPMPDSLSAPDQWLGSHSWEDVDSVVVWACIDTLTKAPAGWDSVNLFSSPYDIQPGRTATFEIVSRMAPEPTPTLRFCAQGFGTLPDAEAMPEAEPTLFRVGTVGEAVGPASDTMPDTRTASDSSLVAPRGLPPNPTWGMLACVGYSLAKPAAVRLVVLTREGGTLRVLVEGPRPAGYHSVTWDGTDAGGQRVAPGEYLARLEIDGRTADSRKLRVLH